MTTSDQAMTWAALLGKWTDFAKSAIALPDDGEGGRLKRAVPDIIGLQAITQALAEIDTLPVVQRAVGVDKAEIGVREHVKTIHELWSGEPLHAGVMELVEDAHAALRAATEGGLEWRVAGEPLVATHPAELLAVLAEMRFRGDLFLPSPGVPLFDTAPCAFCRGPGGAPPEDDALDAIEAYLHSVGETAGPLREPVARQVYRQFDFGRGGPVRDFVAPMDDDLPPGQPLLVPAMLAGEAQAISLPIAGADKQGPLPVEFA